MAVNVDLNADMGESYGRWTLGDDGALMPYLTSANIANAMGVAAGSVLFLRWLNFYGLAGAAVPPYTQWSQTPDIFIKAFQSSWLVVAGLTSIAIITSAMRGADERKKVGVME